MEKKGFVKPAGVTTLKLELTAPITPTSSEGDTTVGFGFNLYKTHAYTLSTEEKIIEDLEVGSSNTDKALTSADIPEIRRNQIQTIYFSGFQAVAYTGDYSSEYSISGSGIVTQIWFDAAISPRLLDFENYVITGYNTSDKTKEEWNDPVDFSTGYENPDGANLIWAIEPADSDITSSQNYTMDKEFASGHLELYRVINIQENEKKYDISALEYSPIKYEGADLGGGGGGPPPGDCELPTGVRISGDEGTIEYCCDRSVKDPNQDCKDTMDEGWELDPNCNDDPENPTRLGTCCVRCGPKGHVHTKVACYDDVTEAECLEWEKRHNSYAKRTYVGG